MKDCIRYYYDEFKLSKGYEIWKNNGKKNEDNVQQMYEAASSPTSVLDEDETMVDGGNNTSHHHICMECCGTGELLMCDRCPNVCHLHCNKPKPLTKVPLGQWFCHKCVVIDRITARVAQYRHDKLSELDKYLPNPTALEIFLQEHKNTTAKRENKVVTAREYEMLPRTTRVQYITKANIATENYRKAKLPIQTDVATFQRKLKRIFKDAEEKQGDASVNTKPTMSKHAVLRSLKDKWRKHRESEIKAYITSQGLKYPESSFDRFKRDLMEQSSEERMGTIQEDAQELWNSLTNAKRALYDNAFQTELCNHYDRELQRIESSTAYTEFVRVLDNEGKRQFFENSQDGLSIQDKKSELDHLISNVGIPETTVALAPQTRRNSIPQYQIQSLKSEGGISQWNSSQSHRLQNRPFDTAQGSNRFLFVNDTNAQDSQFVAMPPATSAPSKSRSLASTIAVRWEKKKRLLLKKYLRSKGVIHPGAPYVMYTAVQRNRAKTDPSIKEETLKAGWTKEVKNHYTELFNKKLRAYRDARKHYENNMEDYKEYLKRVETVEKESFYRRIERQAQQLQTPRSCLEVCRHFFLTLTLQVTQNPS